MLSDFETRGPIKNIAINNVSRFMESSGPAKYESYKGHDSIVLNIGDLPSSVEGPFGVVQFTCTSSQLNGGGNRKALPLLLLFYLVIE